MLHSGIILFLSAVLPAALSVSRSYSETDGITIIADESQLYCDSLNCPESAIKCVVTKSSINNHREIETVRKCLDENGQIFGQSIITEPNPEPGMHINSYAEGSRRNYYSSVNHSSNNLNPEEHRRIMEQHEHIITEGQQMSARIHQQVQSRIDQMQQQIQQRFGKHGW